MTGRVEVKETLGRVAAFFDLDGTLMGRPSMERRFFRLLRYRREIGVRNYWLWFREALRLVPGGIREMRQANKMYLRGVQGFEKQSGRDNGISSGRKRCGLAQEQAAVPLRCNPRLPVPAFFVDALERVAWHAKEGHATVLVSGTLEPLAEEAARSLEIELAARGMTARICVCATRLEERDGRWTGRILGEAMFGEAKARAARWIAAEMSLDLARCFAYGDSAADERLLASVGQAFAVNPSKRLGRIAKKRGWPLIQWNEERDLTQRAQRTQNAQRRKPRWACSVDGETEKQVSGREIKEQLRNPEAMGKEPSRSLG